MSSIGILGGMGPSATVDFMDKIIQLTPAACDQDQQTLHRRFRGTFLRGGSPLP